MSLFSPGFKPRTAARSTPTAALYGSPRDDTLAPMEIESFTLDYPGRGPDEETKQFQHLYVLPVLWLEFLALALTRAVLPSLLLEKYEKQVYLVMGFTEFVKGLLAFIFSPLFGKISDVVGRRVCLLVTVFGTCAPVCSLALLPWEDDPTYETNDATLNITTTSAVAAEDESPAVWPGTWDASRGQQTLHPQAITIFVILLAASGVFSSTFTLVFAYISDSVRQRDERVSAYGLALATFGLSFTIGPMAGGYLAQYNTRYVFVCSLVLTILDLIYIYAILPESRTVQPPQQHSRASRSSAQSISMPQNVASWSPLDTLRIVAVDPFLRRVGQVAFLYYTALWAVISTLMLYAASRFQLGPERLGELMSALGLATMVSEAVLVRLVVPILGEKNAMRVGLAAFGLQCVVLGVAYEGWHLFVCIAFSLLGNLVYPSLSSLVSGSVEPEAVGEALGAVNGIKALTEGFGPLVFGSLMTLSEKSALPGWPYLLAAVIVFLAYQSSRDLPDVQKDDYIHELERKRGDFSLAPFLRPSAKGPPRFLKLEDDDEEYKDLLGSDDDEENEDMALLSEIEDTEGEGWPDESNADKSRLPLTFAMMSKR